MYVRGVIHAHVREEYQAVHHILICNFITSLRYTIVKCVPPHTAHEKTVGQTVPTPHFHQKMGEGGSTNPRFSKIISQKSQGTILTSLTGRRTPAYSYAPTTSQLSPSRELPALQTAPATLPPASSVPGKRVYVLLSRGSSV